MDDWVVILILAGLFMAAWAYALACERLWGGLYVCWRHYLHHSRHYSLSLPSLCTSQIRKIL